MVPVEGRAHELSAEALRDLIRSRADAGQISSFAVPDRIELVDSIPKTSVGKIDKKQIRAQWTDGAR